MLQRLPMRVVPQQSKTKAVTPRSLADVIQRLTAAVQRAQIEEVALNRHLGRSAAYQRGSLSVSMRWDDADTLLHGLKSNATSPHDP